VELPTTWESYLASLDTSFRKKLLKRWRSLEAAGEMTVLEAGKDVSIDQAMKELARLNQERFESGSTAFGGEEMLTFHTNLAKLLHDRGMICLLLLRHKGETIGAGYEFLYAKKAFSYQAGWDSRFAQYGLGHIMTALCMKWCIDRGVQEYDFLCGEPEYKRCWSAKSRVMLDFEELNPQTLRGRAFKHVKAWQKRWIGGKAGATAPARTLPLPADP
jgi:CelD/BcsL family acetyltransferase involved in cellulose biosynthesis